MSIAQTKSQVNRHLWRPGEEVRWHARWARIDAVQAQVDTLMTEHTKASAAIRDYPSPSDWAVAHGMDCQEYQEWSAEIDRLADRTNEIRTKLKRKIDQLDRLMSYAYKRIDMESPDDPPPGEGKDAPIQGHTEDF